MFLGSKHLTLYDIDMAEILNNRSKFLMRLWTIRFNSAKASSDVLMRCFESRVFKNIELLLLILRKDWEKVMNTYYRNKELLMKAVGKNDLKLIFAANER